MIPQDRRQQVRRVPVCALQRRRITHGHDCLLLIFGAKNRPERSGAMYRDRLSAGRTFLPRAAMGLSKIHERTPFPLAGKCKHDVRWAISLG